MAGKGKIANLTAEAIQDIIDSFLNAGYRQKSVQAKVPIDQQRTNLYESLGLEKPEGKDVELLFDRSWYQEYDLLAPPMTYEEFSKMRFDKDLVEIVGGPQEEFIDGAYEKYLSNLGSRKEGPTGALSEIVDE